MVKELFEDLGVARGGAVVAVVWTFRFRIEWELPRAVSRRLACWRRFNDVSFPPDLLEFVRNQMASGKYASEEELLRDAFQALAEEEEDLNAVREAVAEWQAGDPGVPLDEAVETIRCKHGILRDA